MLSSQVEREDRTCREKFETFEQHCMTSNLPYCSFNCVKANHVSLCGTCRAFPRNGIPGGEGNMYFFILSFRSHEEMAANARTTGTARAMRGKAIIVAGRVNICDAEKDKWYKPYNPSSLLPTTDEMCHKVRLVTASWEAI